MQHEWKHRLYRLTHALVLMALFVLTREAAQGQTLAVSPGLDNIAAGPPAVPSTVTPSPASFIGPAAELEPYRYFFGTAVDRYGNVYVSEYPGNIIRVIASGNGPIPALGAAIANPQAGYVYTVAGTGLTPSHTVIPVPDSCTNANPAPTDAYGDGCPAIQAVFGSNDTPALAVDSNGNVYIGDYALGLIRVVYAGGTIAAQLVTAENPSVTSPQTGYIYAIAGTATQSGDTGDGNIASAAQVGRPNFVAVDSHDNIYFTDSKNKVLRAISADGSALPGYAAPTPGYIYSIVGTTGTVQDGIAASTSMFQGTPNGIAIDPNNNVYVANQYGVRVIYVGGLVPGLNAATLTPGNIYTVAGALTAAGTTTLPTFPNAITAIGANLPSAQIQGLALDSAGNLYITDSSGGLIYKMDTSGNLMQVYGTGTTCPSAVDTDNDGCSGGSVYHPDGIAVDPQGNVYVADFNTQLYVLHEQNVASPSYYFTPGQTQPVVIYNTGNEDLTLSNIALSSSAFTVGAYSPLPTGTVDCSNVSASNSVTLTPGQSCILQVTFPAVANAPAAAETLTVTSNSTNGGTNVIQLTGESAANAALCSTSVIVSGNTVANSLTAPATVNLSYDVQLHCSQPTPAATGTLTVYSGNTLSGNASLATTAVNITQGNTSGLYSFSAVSLPTGYNFIHAVYSGDSLNATSTSTDLLADVNGAATTTALAASPTTASVGSTVNLMATVSPSPATTPPTGSVTFMSGTTVLGTGSLTPSGSNGVATFSTMSLPAGADPITAVYTGDDTYNTSTSAATIVNVVQPVTTATTVSASPTGIAIGQTVNVTATVTATSGTAAPTGTVTFSDTNTNNGNTTTTSLGTANLGSSSTTSATATLTGVSLPEGQNAISASYGGSGDNIFIASSTTQPATVTVGLPATATSLIATPSSVNYGDSVTLTAKVIPQIPGNTVSTGTVTFAVGSTILKTVAVDTTGTATLTTTALPGGSGSVTDQVTAAYQDSSATWGSSTSTAVPVTVAALATTTGLNVSSLSPTYGDTVTLTATVATAGAITPTGTVTFYSGNTPIGSSSLNGSGVATYSTSSLVVGSDSIAAAFVGGVGFQASTSNTTVITVAPQPAGTTVALSASQSTVFAGNAVTFTAAVTAAVNGTPVGLVTFLAASQSGTATLGYGTLNSSGVTTLSTNTLAVGTYSITAVYQGNGTFTGSTSTHVTLIVNPVLAVSTTALTLSNAAVTQGQNVTFTANVGPSSPITPTGMVSFMAGGLTLGTGNLNGGIATYSTTGLGAGNYSVTAVYGGDSNYSGSQSTAVSLSVATPTPSFTLNATPTNLILQSGQTGEAIITLVPTYNYAGTIALSCGTLPANVTCSFSPATLTADGKNDTVQSTLTISTSNGMAQLHEHGSFWRGQNNAVLSAALFFLPAGLLGLGFTDKRKRLRRYLSLAVLVFLGTGLLAISGCAGGNGGSSTDAAKGTSQIVVTAAGSAGSQSQTVNLAITIQ